MCVFCVMLFHKTFQSFAGNLKTPWGELFVIFMSFFKSFLMSKVSLIHQIINGKPAGNFCYAIRHIPSYNPADSRQKLFYKEVKVFFILFVSYLSKLG